MNFLLSQLPERINKPRDHGITMVMDKGLSIEETRNFLSIAEPYVDVVKLGFGTAYVTPDLDKKLAVYHEARIPIYFGGTLFEAFLIRDQLEDYIQICQRYGVGYMEVSDGSVNIDHREKCKIIERLTQ